MALRPPRAGCCQSIRRRRRPSTCSRCCRVPSALDSTREERVRKAFSVDHHGPGDARLSHIRVVLRVPTASKATMWAAQCVTTQMPGTCPSVVICAASCALCRVRASATALPPTPLPSRLPAASKHSCARAGCRAIALGGGDCRGLRVGVFLPEVRELIRDTRVSLEQICRKLCHQHPGRRPPI